MATNIDQFILPGTQFVPVEAVILCDSIGQHIGAKVIKTECEVYPGCKITKLAQKLSNKYINISGYKCITIIVGTCDISSKYVWKSKSVTGVLPPHTPKPIEDIIKEYRSLLDVIRNQNSIATILVCSIIPRPFDHTENKQYLKNLNKQLEVLSKFYPNCKYLNISKQFLHCGEPIDAHFDKDGIHLSPTGNSLLTDILNSVIGQMLKL